MASASLAAVAERLASLEAKVDAMQVTQATLSRQDEEAARSRARIYEGIEAIKLTLVTVNHRLDVLDAADRAMQPSLAELRNLRERAAGAGTLGVWLWRFGGLLISFAAGIAAAWTAMTGRPPP